MKTPEGGGRQTWRSSFERKPEEERIRQFRPKSGEFFEATLEDRFRIAIKYDGGWRPILWLSVGEDGSLYLGPRYQNISTLRRGVVPVEGGQFRILYSDGEHVTDPTLIKQAKVSFHSSGAINLLDERAYRDSLRTLKEQFLCGMVFHHPSAFVVTPTRRKRDIWLPYPIDEGRPLQGHLYVAPLGGQKPVLIRSAVHQENLYLACRGLKEAPDLVIQICFAHGPEGPWPPTTYILAPTPAPPQPQPSA